MGWKKKRKRKEVYTSIRYTREYLYGYAVFVAARILPNCYLIPTSMYDIFILFYDLLFLLCIDMQQITIRTLSYSIKPDFGTRPLRTWYVYTRTRLIIPAWYFVPPKYLL